jgi:dienelactone hydrolase
MLRHILLFGLSAIGLAAADDFDTQLGRRLLQDRQPLIEAQIHLASRVKPMPLIATRAAWQREAASIRKQVLDRVLLRGEAAKWREIPTKPEWLDVLPGDGYKVRKFRYEVLPGMWIPGLLYEPDKLDGRVPVVINVNGHEGAGVSIDYSQQRCIHLARNGVLAYNYEWFMKGQMSDKDFDHARLNQIDLTGTSGLAPFFLAQRRLVDVALEHKNADPERVAVTGLSGGGWQTIILSSMDTRVKMAVPVAGYSSFITRAQFDKDLGDSEQTPVDLALYADYTHLTALLAPRPALIINNSYDNCCFRADYAMGPLLTYSRPFFGLYDAADKLRHHANFDAGHNYGPDNRLALYRFINEHFLTKGHKISETEDAGTRLRTADELKMPLPEPNLTFNGLARKLASDLPQPLEGIPEMRRERLREVVRWPAYRVDARPVSSVNAGGLTITAWRLMIGDEWTVPAVEFAPQASEGATVLLGDVGRAKLGAEVKALIARKQRVLALDPFYLGESAIESKAYLYALLMSSIGERPLGVQAAQVAAAARWMKARATTVAIETHGPRTGLIGLVAAAGDPQTFAAVRLFRPMKSVRDPIEKNMVFADAPELFCFGLLKSFDMPQLHELARPAKVEVDPK